MSLARAETRCTTVRPRATHECVGRSDEQRARNVSPPNMPALAGRLHWPRQGCRWPLDSCQAQLRARLKRGRDVGTAVAGRLAAISRKSSRRRMSNELEFRRRYKTTSSSRRSSQARLWRPRPTGCRSTVDAHGLLGATSPLATPAHDAVAAALRASTALRGETAASQSHRGSHPPACPQHTAAAGCPLGKSCTAQPFRRGGASLSSRRTLAARSSSVATGAVASRQGGA